MAKKTPETIGPLTPLYGFMEGDTLVILILGYGNETVASLIGKLQKSVALRVKTKISPRLIHNGKIVDPSLSLREAKIEAFDRVDVIEGSQS